MISIISKERVYLLDKFYALELVKTNKITAKFF